MINLQYLQDTANENELTRIKRDTFDIYLLEKVSRNGRDGAAILPSYLTTFSRGIIIRAITVKRGDKTSTLRLISFLEQCNYDVTNDDRRSSIITKRKNFFFFFFCRFATCNFIKGSCIHTLFIVLKHIYYTLP